MNDHLIRATVPGVRGFAAITTNLAEEARRRHDCYPIATAALGRTLTGALLLAANLKTAESLTIRIEGNGPLGNIVADANPQGAVRGYVKNPHIYLPLRKDKLDVGQAVGQGQIYVTRFTGLKQPFTGSAPLTTGEIAEDMANYLLLSEQTPSTVALGVLVDPDLTVRASGGFIIQAMPGANDDILAKIEDNLAQLPPVSFLVNSGYSAGSLLERVFQGLPVNMYEQYELTFHCPCSRQRVHDMLISLGQQELTEMAKEGQAEIICHYCNAKHEFNRQELEELLTKVTLPKS